MNIPSDKILHVVVSVALVVVAASAIEALTEFWIALVSAISLTIIAGLLKEYWDSKGHGDAEKEDLLADAIGVGIGATIMLLIWILKQVV